jgi:hypothetical protein
VSTLDIAELRSEILRNFPRIAAPNVERALAALVDGGAAPRIVAVAPIRSGSYLGMLDGDGKRIAWLHVGHIDIAEAYAPDYAFLSGYHAGASRVPFPGYSESRSPQRRRPTPLPCQMCFNVHAPDEECF